MYTCEPVEMSTALWWASITDPEEERRTTTARSVSSHCQSEVVQSTSPLAVSRTDQQEIS
ncbi:MAG: hypothetical protein IPI41_03285 [Flavobacteriales bacterium]|nr:hypothetical protein [Flavobacteriales bacterium]